MKRGLLIVFEGVDGTGKTTQLKLLADFLRDKGVDVVETREPTDGTYGRKIRALYTDRSSVTPEQELQLFISDRKEHVDNLINPALERGTVVLTDRYYYSTAAYQGAAGADPESILQANSFAPVPDLVCLLVMDVDNSLRRIQEQRKDQLNDFEQAEQLEKVAAIFDSFSDPHIQRIEAGKNVSSVQEDIRKKVSTLFSAKNWEL
jgi:dTMP kinase